MENLLAKNLKSFFSDNLRQALVNVKTEKRSSFFWKVLKGDGRNSLFFKKDPVAYIFCDSIHTKINPSICTNSVSWDKPNGTQRGHPVRMFKKISRLPTLTNLCHSKTKLLCLKFKKTINRKRFAIKFSEWNWGHVGCGFDNLADKLLLNARKYWKFSFYTIFWHYKLFRIRKT